jgi:hypothetical protein
MGAPRRMKKLGGFFDSRDGAAIERFAAMRLEAAC